MEWIYWYLSRVSTRCQNNFHLPTSHCQSIMATTLLNGTHPHLRHRSKKGHSSLASLTSKIVSVNKTHSTRNESATNPWSIWMNCSVFLNIPQSLLITEQTFRTNRSSVYQWVSRQWNIHITAPRSVSFTIAEYTHDTRESSPWQTSATAIIPLIVQQLKL